MRIYTFGPFEIELSEETLRRNGEKVNINHRMFQVLRLLIERKGEIVTKQEFFEKVWDGSFVEDNNLTVTITALRKALGDNAKQARFIENIPRKGYRFIAHVEYSDSASSNKSSIVDPNGSHSNPPVTSDTIFEVDSQAANSRAKRSIWIPIAVSLALIISTFAIVVGGRKANWQMSSPTTDRIDSVAILPFKTQSVDAEYLADGLTDSVIGNLSKQPGLRVIDRNSSNSYRNKTSDPVTAGRELGVGAVVIGQIEQSGDALVINAEMIDMANNNKLWQQQFRRRSSDLYATQLEISHAIAQNLRLEPTNATPGENRKGGSRDPAAFDLYLKGRYYWNKRTNPDFRKSAEFFKAAIDKDPTFAQAYIGLANAYTLGGYADHSASLDEKNAIVRATIQRALEIDDSLGEAYSALAINKCYYDWDFPGAESDYRRAIELNPNDSTAHHWYAEFLAMQGRFDESFTEYDRALSLDPLSLPIQADRAFTYYYSRDFDKAIELLNKITANNPDYMRAHEFLNLVYREKGMFNEAVESSEKVLGFQFKREERTAEEYKRLMTYFALLKKAGAEAGSVGYWRFTLESNIDPTPYSMATIYANLGESDKAFEYLEKAFENRHTGMVWLKVTPDLDRIRSDPRYKDLLRRVGFSN